MTTDWNAFRLDLFQLDEAMRTTLREMRPFVAKSLPGILARFYDKVRHYDPASGLFKEGVMQEAIRLQLQHWDLIGGGDFGLAYISSVTRVCEFNQRAGVAALSPGDKIECGVDGVGTLKVTIGKPA